MNTFFTQLNTICIHAGSDHLIQNPGETAHALPAQPGARILRQGDCPCDRGKYQRGPERTGKSRIIWSHIRNEKREPAVLFRQP